MLNEEIVAIADNAGKRLCELRFLVEKLSARVVEGAARQEEVVESYKRALEQRDEENYVIATEVEKLGEERRHLVSY